MQTANQFCLTLLQTFSRLGQRIGETSRALPGRARENEAMSEREEAVEYDAMVSEHAKLLHAPFLEMIARLGISQGRVIDIGCGPGQIAVALAMRYPDMRVTGVDLSDEMLALARARAAEMDVQGRVMFIKGDARRLPFAGGSFDLVISHFMAHHLENPVELFDEADRLAGDKGVVVVKDLLRQPPLLARILLLFSRFVLRYSRRQLRLYRNSLDAALSLKDVLRFQKDSRLRDAGMIRHFFLDFALVRGRRCPEWTAPCARPFAD